MTNAATMGISLLATNAAMMATSVVSANRARAARRGDRVAAACEWGSALAVGGRPPGASGLVVEPSVALAFCRGGEMTLKAALGTRSPASRAVVKLTS